MLSGMAGPLLSPNNFVQIGNETFGPGRGNRQDRPNTGRRRRGGEQFDIEVDGKMYAYEPESGTWYDRSDMSDGQRVVRDPGTLRQLNGVLEQQEQQGMDNILREVRTAGNEQPQQSETVMGAEPKGSVLSDQPEGGDLPDLGVDADTLERMAFQANNNPQVVSRLATMYQEATGDTARDPVSVISWARNMSRRMRQR